MEVKEFLLKLREFAKNRSFQKHEMKRPDRSAAERACMEVSQSLSYLITSCEKSQFERDLLSVEIRAHWKNVVRKDKEHGIKLFNSYRGNLALRNKMKRFLQSGLIN